MPDCPTETYMRFLDAIEEETFDSHYAGVDGMHIDLHESREPSFAKQVAD